MNIFEQGQHYGVPGIKVDGSDLENTLKTAAPSSTTSAPRAPPSSRCTRTASRATRRPRARARPQGGEDVGAAGVRPVSSSTRARRGPRARRGVKRAKAEVKRAWTSPRLRGAAGGPREGARVPRPPDTDYNKRAPSGAEATQRRRPTPRRSPRASAHRRPPRQGTDGTISIGDALNLAVLEEMMRDPKTTCHAEDSRRARRTTSQAHAADLRQLRAADEIIDEGHFIGKALGEGMNGYRPIVELMNTNFGIYGIAEMSSAGNTYATTGGQFKMPMTIIGAGGTALNQSLGAEHSQPLHAYVMGIPGLKICTAASPEAAYGLAKSMIRDDGPGILFTPVKQMKDVKSFVPVDVCQPLNKAKVLHSASEASVKARKAVTVLTYLHGVKEANLALEEIQAEGLDIDLLEMRSPLLDVARSAAPRAQQARHPRRVNPLGCVGATISAMVSEQLTSSTRRSSACMDDAPVLRRRWRRW